MMFHLSPIISLIATTASKLQKVYSNNVHENINKLSNDYIVGDLVYLDKTGIYLNLDYKKRQHIK